MKVQSHWVITRCRRKTLDFKYWAKDTWSIMKPGGQGDSDVLLSDYLVLARADFRLSMAFAYIAPLSEAPCLRTIWGSDQSTNPHSTRRGLGMGGLEPCWNVSECTLSVCCYSQLDTISIDCLRKLLWILILMIQVTFCETEQLGLRPSDFLQRGADLGYDKVQCLFQFGIYIPPWDCCQGCKRLYKQHSLTAQQELGSGWIRMSTSVGMLPAMPPHLSSLMCHES